ncbi:hypothetical protein B0H11DRAFT_2228146 [Mycena galericulata]|nr:hypothetical protein B0H11DRAFT_2228146 [Mycena galericulata]
MPSFFRSKHHNVDESASDPRESQRMEILLDHDHVFLRGTGADVEPARLSGNVALYLNEPTTIRSITLMFRGKAFLPVPLQQDPLSSSNPPSTYVLCKHNWSFLEGQKKHNYTLKAGRHLFPFQIQLGGSLPCSIITDAFGGASVTYKLRAVAQRTGFSHNIQAVTPVYVLRSLGQTALEYQQTRDIEHVWAEKLMFSVAIPHIAWAAGDELVALLKVSPLVKGVGVLNVTSSLRETTKVFNRSGSLTRTVATTTHEIIGGKAVEVRETVDDKGKHSHFSLPPQSHSGSEAGPSGASGSSSDASPTTTLSEPAQGEDDVVTVLNIRLPSYLTPSHPLEPITVTHSIHWSVIVTNADGHLSELFCSLPILLLDPHLLSEARLHTKDTGELPTYIAHVRDRVANMFLSEGNTLRVTNPWIQSGVNPIILEGEEPTPGHPKPLHVISDSNNPYMPDPDHPVFLDWVNAELLISQGATKVDFSSSPSADDTSASAEGSTSTGTSTPHHPPTPPTPPADGIATYTHASNASRALPGLFVAIMEPTSAITHPHWLTARPDPKDPARRRRRSTTCSAACARYRGRVPDYEIALRGFLGGVPPLSSMQGLPSYDEASAQWYAAHRDTAERWERARGRRRRFFIIIM